jgi:hypothetical protein
MASIDSVFTKSNLDESKKKAKMIFNFITGAYAIFLLAIIFTNLIKCAIINSIKILSHGVCRLAA